MLATLLAHQDSCDSAPRFPHIPETPRTWVIWRDKTVQPFPAAVAVFVRSCLNGGCLIAVGLFVVHKAVKFEYPIASLIQSRHRSAVNPTAEKSAFVSRLLRSARAQEDERAFRCRSEIMERGRV